MNDAPSIWGIIGPTIRAGETYAMDRDMTEADALAYWLGDDRKTFVAEENGNSGDSNSGDTILNYYFKILKVKYSVTGIPPILRV
jgi:hypothetical protein